MRNTLRILHCAFKPTDVFYFHNNCYPTLQTEFINFANGRLAMRRFHRTLSTRHCQVCFIRNTNHSSTRGSPWLTGDNGFSHGPCQGAGLPVQIHCLKAHNDTTITFVLRLAHAPCQVTTIGYIGVASPLSESANGAAHQSPLV